MISWLNYNIMCKFQVGKSWKMTGTASNFLKALQGRKTYTKAIRSSYCTHWVRCRVPWARKCMNSFSERSQHLWKSPAPQYWQRALRTLTKISGKNTPESSSDLKTNIICVQVSKFFSCVRFLTNLVLEIRVVVSHRREERWGSHGLAFDSFILW